MDSNHLEPDELKVECDLGNMVGLLYVRQSMMAVSLTNESSGDTTY